MKITRSKLKQLVRKEMNRLLKEGLQGDLADAKKEWARARRAVKSALADASAEDQLVNGYQDKKGVYKFKRGAPLRDDFRKAAIKLRAARKALKASKSSAPSSAEGVGAPAPAEPKKTKFVDATWPGYGEMLANRERLGIPGQPGRGAINAPGKWYHGLHRDEAMKYYNENYGPDVHKWENIDDKTQRAMLKKRNQWRLKGSEYEDIISYEPEGKTVTSVRDPKSDWFGLTKEEEQEIRKIMYPQSQEGPVAGLRGRANALLADVPGGRAPGR